MNTTFKVEGLKAVVANLAEMEKRVQFKIARAALRATGNILTRKIKAQTYTTFARETGFIQKGFSTGVAKINPASAVQYASVFQRKQSIAGKSKLALTIRTRSAKRGKTGKSKTEYIAFWWKFIDQGTKARLGRGSVRARPWTVAAAASVASSAVNAFRDRMTKGVNDEARSLPSTRGKP